MVNVTCGGRPRLIYGREKQIGKKVLILTLPGPGGPTRPLSMNNDLYLKNGFRYGNEIV